MTTATAGGTAARTGRKAAGTGVSSRRRWRVPPPLLQDGQGPGPEGLGILEEFRSELGAVLWKTLRSVLLWAEEDAHTRDRLFEEGAVARRKVEIVAGATGHDDGRLREALEDLLPLLDRPERADPELAGLACKRIATWADARGAPHTALEYLQAAAVCVPANPQYALGVGQAARRLGRHGRAEAWIHRAIGLSRQAGDWDTYASAYLAHGEMMLRRDALPAARRSIVKALRRTRRHGGADGAESRALRTLFLLEARAGNRSEALSIAHEALDRHAPGDPRLIGLAFDIATHWLEAGDSGLALPILIELLGGAKPEDRPAILGAVARAAAHEGDDAGFNWARAELERLDTAAELPEAWADVARSAGLPGRPAEAAARSAESVDPVAAADREGARRLARDLIRKLRETRDPDSEKG